MNKVILTGRITKDLELKYTANNNAVCEFTIATNRPITKDGEKKADFIMCTVYGKSAENLQKYQGKGSLIGVIGENRVDQWQDDQGNNKYKHYVLVNNIEFLGSKSDGQAANKATDINVFEEFGKAIEVTDEDLPF